MKQKKVIGLTILFLILFSCTAFAQEKKMRSPIFMGEVQAVEIDEVSNVMRITAKGYIKDCKIFNQEIIAIVSEQTLIIPDTCPMDINEQFKKVNPVEFQINKGDSIYMVLNNAMTKSTPPQVGVKSIQVTTPN